MPLKYKFFFFLLVSTPIFSQKFQGIAESNYAGTLGVFNNPANVVDTRQMVFINLAGVGIEFQNNYVRWDAPYSVGSMIINKVSSQYRNSTNNKIIVKDTYKKTNENVNNVAAYLNGAVIGPSIGLDIKKWKMGVAGGIRYRYLNSISNTDPSIGNSLVLGAYSKDFVGKDIKNSSLYINSGFFNEIYGTMGLVIKNDAEQMVKVGATAKYIYSNSFGSIEASDFSYKLQNDPTNPSLNELVLADVKGSLASASIYEKLELQNFTTQMRSINGQGKGLGLDLGVVYEFRPDYRKFSRNRNGKNFTDPTINKYTYKISFSLIDIGFLKFSGPMVKLNSLDGKTQTINFGDIQKFKGIEQLIGDLESIFGLGPGQSSFSILMPASAVTSFDYKYSEKLYLNLTYRQYLLPSARRGVIGHSGLYFTPRFEKKYFEFAIPVGLDNNFRNFNLGLSMRAAGLYFGFDNLTGIFNTFNPRGASLFAGAFIPIYHKLPGSPLKCFDVNNKPSFKKRRGLIRRK